MKKLLLVAICFAFNSFGNMMAQYRIEPFVFASWNQTAPFNNECPDGAVAGCGPIAVSMILNYYRILTHGYGHAVYDNVDVDFDNRSFDWPNILDRYPNGGYSEIEANAVASLVFQVGAAMKVKYGDSTSPYNYPSMIWGLHHHLHFSPLSRYRNRHFYSTANWLEMLNNELENGHPVFYRGDHTQPGKANAGHMFVIDGRDGEGRYHFNFGHASKQQDKFTDLNIINQGDGIWPGAYSVSYHHRQAMVTDFYPVEGLTDEDYEHTALVLNTPIVLNGDSHARTIKKTGSIQAKFQFRYVSFDAGSAQFSLGFYQQDELIAVSGTVRNTTLSMGGNAVNVDRSFLLPANLEDGNYEMSLISRDDENSQWVRGWDNAPNRIACCVENGVYTFTLPTNHTLETCLYLTDDKIQEVASNENGKTLEMTVCNTSDNNFEDSLRIVVSANGMTRTYHMPTSIYNGQSITYRFFVANNEIDVSNDYSVVAYYKEVNNGEWIQLLDYTSGMKSIKQEGFNGVEIYTLNGLMIKKIDKQDIDANYSDVLYSLKKGIYIIRENNETRKFVKR